MAPKIHRMVGPAWPDMEPYDLHPNFSQNTGDSPPADAPAWLENSTRTTTDITVPEASDAALQDWVALHSYFQWSGVTTDNRNVGVLGAGPIALQATSASATADYKMRLALQDTTNRFAIGATLRLTIIQDTSGGTPYDTWLYVNGILEAATTTPTPIITTSIAFLDSGSARYEGTRRWANTVLVSGSSESDIDETNYAEIKKITPDGAGTYTEFSDGNDVMGCVSDDGLASEWDDWATGSHDGDTT